eukprot:Sspe_Gene.51627::Locus_28647_Transcript_1_1_Confidence_1.000_Length_1570::g.51627::m.51627
MDEALVVVEESLPDAGAAVPNEPGGDGANLPLQHLNVRFVLVYVKELVPAGDFVDDAPNAPHVCRVAPWAAAHNLRGPVRAGGDQIVVRGGAEKRRTPQVADRPPLPQPVGARVGFVEEDVLGFEVGVHQLAVEVQKAEGTRQLVCQERELCLRDIPHPKLPRLQAGAQEVKDEARAVSPREVGPHVAHLVLLLRILLHNGLQHLQLERGVASELPLQDLHGHKLVVVVGVRGRQHAGKVACATFLQHTVPPCDESVPPSMKPRGVLASAVRSEGRHSCGKERGGEGRGEEGCITNEVQRL